MATIDWKGYTWTLRDELGPYYDFDPANVSVDSNGYLNLAITNPTNAHPIASEIICNSSLGYGTYRIVVETDMTSLHKNIVFGGLWLQNTGTYYTNYYTEFDVCEISKWDTAGDTTIYHNAWYHDHILQNDTATLPAGVQTHIFRWSKDMAIFQSYMGEVGENPHDEPYFETVFTQNVPVPTNEVPRIQTWCYRVGKDADDLTVTPTTIIIRDFTFTKLANTAGTSMIRGVSNGKYKR